MRKMPFVSDNYEPVAVETSAHDLVVEGTLPPELTGNYLRNGHNPRPGTTPKHWFQGQGMLHGVRLAGGRAEWYRNRWVRTPAFDGASPHRPDGWMDLTVRNAGTDVVEHAGRLLALSEASLPYEVTADLDTVGVFDFHGSLASAMTAHPKEDPATGELHFYSYSPFPPHLIYLVAGTDGRIVRSEEVPGAGPTFKHDFGITQTRAVFLDLPVVFDRGEASGVPFRWRDEYPARIGIVDRTGPLRTTWIEVDPGMVLHVSNVYDAPDGRVVLEGPRYDRAGWETSWKWWVGAPGYPADPASGTTAHRWILDPATGTVQEELVDDLVTEFPTINDAYTGRPSSVSYQIGFPGAGLEEIAVVKLDAASGRRTVRPVGPDVNVGEATFVPAAGGSAEDDGYLLTIATDARTRSSQLLVLDAHDLSTRAAVQLPQRVPVGLHASWIPDDHHREGVAGPGRSSTGSSRTR